MGTPEGPRASENRVGPHEVIPFRPERNATLDTLRWARKRHQIPTLLEVDVTDARAAIRDFRRRTGEELSFTAWVVRCIARAAAEHPRVHSLRRGRRRLVVFPGVLSWGIPLSLHPLAVSVGGMAQRKSADGKRHVLALAVVFDHAVTDGAPVGRFIHRLHELLTRAEELGA